MAKRQIEDGYPIAVQPATYDEGITAALQALQKGTANGPQQQKALKWLIEDLCGTYDADYRQNDRDHAYKAGQRGVGLQVVKQLHLNLTVLTAPKK